VTSLYVSAFRCIYIIKANFVWNIFYGS